MRVLDLYAGIGGLAAALGGSSSEVVAAIDVNPIALEVYRHNFPHPTLAAAVESIPVTRWRRWDADLWWLSPPCQPYTRRGLGRDLDDPRAASFAVILERISEIRPPYVALENVPPFRASRAHGRLLETLARAGYRTIHETVLCPSELGLPNRRRRYYLVASRRRLLPLDAGREAPPPAPLAGFIDRDPDPALAVDAGLLARYEGALDIVHAEDPAATTSCFTSAYGRSPVRSGSYLATASGARHFSPAEILRLLAFPAGYELPPGLTRDKTWRLVGNSLSIAALGAVLAAVPELAEGLMSGS